MESSSAMEWGRRGGRCVLALVAGLVIAARPAAVSAQAPALGVYADPSGAECNVAWSPTTTFYVVYRGSPGIRGISFAAPPPACMASAVLLAEDYGGPYIVSPGNSRDGITLTHFTCDPPPTPIMSIMYLVPTPSSPCCAYAVIAHPAAASGQIEAMDCSGNLFYVAQTVGMFMGDATCPCPVGGPVPVEETRRGRIKALYD